MCNSVLHAGQKVSVEGSIVFLTRYMDSLLQCRQGSSQHDTKGKQCALVGNRHPSEADRQVQKRWSPPPPGSLKINVDGAFIPSSGQLL